jgi:predicted glutamine amidotransferase
MCRHIGYIGRKKDLYSILLKHKHSLIELAYKPKLMNEATLNADGFGLAWKNKEVFKLYKNYLPIWNDLNLDSLSKSISSNLVIGNVRSATISENQGYFNTHPFNFNNFCFSHNGFIKNFNHATRKKILKYLNPKYINFVKGQTDSELIFILLMQIRDNEKDIGKSIKNTIQIVKDNCDACMLNFLIATFDKNGKNALYATKFSAGIKTPSLFYSKHKNEYTIISSEKLNNDIWFSIKNNSLIKASDNKVEIEKI